MYDIILKGCRLFDGERFYNEPTDIAIERGRIAKIGTVSDCKAEFVRDCTGMTVTPGLIDAHAHFAPFAGIGVDPHLACLPFGVTAVLDAGSVGCNTVDSVAGAMYTAPVETRLFMNVCSSGLNSLRSYPEDIDPAKFDRAKIERMFDKYPDKLCGLKIRMGKECSLHYGKEPLKAALELAHGIGVPLCTHVSNPDFPAGELAEMMGEGDIFTHTYQGRGNTILDGDKIDIRILRARERGVIFDVGDACFHLDFEVFSTALATGFAPDLIGSDITDKGVFHHGVFALPMTLSKLVSMGMNEADVLRTATSKAADTLGFKGGRIAEGRAADIAVFRAKHNCGTFKDGKGHIIDASYYLVPQLTVKNGSVAWCNIEFREGYTENPAK
ncbi:MAG: amidohydrolase family protein [Clostridia bacterium]|nr:amidohydrolase family protein [Clostridia bacterium]